MTFENALENLEKLVQQLESGETGLEDSMKKFEEGQELIKFCLEKLNKADEQIKKLEKNSQGNIQVGLFDQTEEQSFMEKISIIGIVVNPLKPQVSDPLDKLDHWISKNDFNVDFIIHNSSSKYVKPVYRKPWKLPDL